MIDLLKEAARIGGEVLLSYFRKDVNISEKSSFQNIVTEADIAAQKVIKEKITQLMKEKGHDESEVGFIGEEDLDDRKKYTFVIDPLDGTTNFACGAEEFWILIGAFYESQLIAGVMYMPFSGKFYLAENGQGAFIDLNDHRETLQISKKELKSRLVATHIHPELFHEFGSTVMKFLPYAMGIQAGSHFADYLVENVYSLVIVGKAYIWDIAGPKAVIEEAGGKMYDWDGNEMVLDLNNPKKKYAWLACHPDNLQEVLKIMKS